jgi:hypothetical protein
VDLSDIWILTHFESKYSSLKEGQMEGEYDEAVATHGSFTLNMAVAGKEGLYEGWCGCYDRDSQQPGVLFRED